MTADYELVDAADKVFAYKRVEGEQPIWWLSISQVKSRLTIVSWGWRGSHANTRVEQVLESGKLAPWDAFVSN